MQKLAAGNWKMNGSTAALAEVQALLAAHPAPACDMLLCPPATLLAPMAALAAGSALAVGGQDCHPETAGAHTGDISAAMLADAGASYVILGHSERRADHGETDALVRTKAEAAIAAGLIAIVCLGETEAERDAGDTLAVIGAQLDGSVPATATAATLVIAYEPVWAIGTGSTDLRETEVQQPNTTATLSFCNSSRAFSANSGQFEAGSTTTASSFLPSRPPFWFCSSTSISTVSFSVVSLIAIVPDSECNTPTLMVSAAWARVAPSVSAPVSSQGRNFGIVFVMRSPRIVIVVGSVRLNANFGRRTSINVPIKQYIDLSMTCSQFTQSNGR